MRDVRHSAKSVEYYGPLWLAQMARAVLGRIDLDPFSCPEANRIIQADTIYTVTDGGFSQPWFGRVYCNPPGGRHERKHNRAAFAWYKAMREPIDAMIFVAFNLEFFRYTQRYPVTHPLDCSVCFLRDRICFENPEGATAPAHPSAIIGYKVDRDLFRSVFGPMGKVIQ